jgi:hypothetical protein
MNEVEEDGCFTETHCQTDDTCMLLPKTPAHHDESVHVE